MRDPSEQLYRIQQAIAKIMQYTKKGRRRFDRDETIRISIIHYLQTIGEAAHALPKDFKDRHPEIAWKQMTGFRNFLAHYYVEIDRDAVWQIVEHDLPDLKLKIDAELGRLQSISEYSKKADSVASRRELVQTIDELLQAKREDILRTAVKHGASNVRVFGSVVRGEADEESDIDLLVDMEPGRTLFDISELLMDLQDLLGRDVDVVTEKGLNDRIRGRVLKEAVPL